MSTDKDGPLNAPSRRPGRGRMTWIGIVAIVLFVLALAFVILRPAVDEADGPEPERPQVLGPAPSPGAQ